VWELDHAIGVVNDLTDTQRRKLEDRLGDRLLARAARAEDDSDAPALISARAKLRGARPEQPDSARTELDQLVDELRARVRSVPAPAGIPDLESRLALPKR
jgi:hypothetical protein